MYSISDIFSLDLYTVKVTGELSNTRREDELCYAVKEEINQKLFEHGEDNSDVNRFFTEIPPLRT